MTATAYINDGAPPLLYVFYTILYRSLRTSDLLHGYLRYRLLDSNCYPMSNQYPISHSFPPLEAAKD